MAPRFVPLRGMRRRFQAGELARLSRETLPMLRHVAEPLHARGLEADVRIEAAGDGTVDDGLLLLVQERDQLSLGADVAPNAPVGVVEKADDCGLLGRAERGTFELATELVLDALLR